MGNKHQFMRARVFKRLDVWQQRRAGAIGERVRISGTVILQYKKKYFRMKEGRKSDARSRAKRADANARRHMKLVQTY